MTGIYKIQSNTNPSKFYIGSANNIYSRFNNHKCDLRKNKHANKKLQYHYNKYGEGDLILSVVAICDKEELIPIDKIIRPEQFFIWAYNPWFNILEIAGKPPCKYGEDNPFYGKQHTEETKQKLSEANKGKTPWLGKKHSWETIEKMRLSKIGNKYCVGREVSDKVIAALKRPKSQDTIEKIRQSKLGKPGVNKGIPKSEETRRKISESLMGRKHALMSDETKRRMSEAKKGCEPWNKNKTNVYSFETLERMKEARLLYWEVKKNNYDKV